MNANAIKNNKFLIITFTFVIISICGCKANLNGMNISFVGENEFSEERVFVLSSGLFIHKVNIKKNGLSLTREGHWDFDKKNGYIIFDENFILVTDINGNFNPTYNCKSHGFVVLPVRRIFGTLFMGSKEAISYKADEKGDAVLKSAERFEKDIQKCGGK